MAEVNRASAAAAIDKPGWFHSIAATIRDWRERRQLAGELADLAVAGELDAVMSDIGISRSQLSHLLRTPAGARRLLDAMTRRLGIDLEAMPAAQRRDVEWTCALCEAQKSCRSWLRSEAVGFAAFCPNTPVFKRLRRAAAVAAKEPAAAA